MYFQSSKLHDIKKWQSLDKKLKSFKNKYLKFLLKHFVENGKENLPSNDYSFLSNFKNAKTNTILQPGFNKFLQFYFLATSNVPYFSTKKKSVIMFKMTNF